MNRRVFLTASIAGAAAAAAAGGGAAIVGAANPQAGGTQPPSTRAPLAAPPPGVEYFTQERLEKAIDTTAPINGIDFQLATFVCNLWHPTPPLEKWFGKGF